MSKTTKFDDILNVCIERVIQGESIQSCLEAYPEYAKELEPLLQTAIETLHAADIQPRPEFRQRASREFQKAVQNLKPRGSAHSAWKWPLRWVIPVTAVFAVLVAGTGTVFAASSSQPDQPLYSVKLLTENARLALATSPAGKAELYAQFADTRVNEIVKMADEGKVAPLEKATARMNSNLAAIARLNQHGANVEESRAGTTSADTSSGEPTPAFAPSITTPADVTMPPTKSAVPNFSASNTTITRAPTSKSFPATSQNATSRAPSALSAASTNATRLPTARQSVSAINTSDKDRLQTTVSQQAQKNAEKLQEALKRVPDSVKPSLEKAINDAGKGYGEAIKNISDKK
jgi:hypothetical protein